MKQGSIVTDEQRQAAKERMMPLVQEGRPWYPGKGWPHGTLLLYGPFRGVWGYPLDLLSISPLPVLRGEVRVVGCG